MTAILKEWVFLLDPIRLLVLDPDREGALVLQGDKLVITGVGAVEVLAL
jgi:hypothetical protein